MHKLKFIMKAQFTSFNTRTVSRVQSMSEPLSSFSIESFSESLLSQIGKRKVVYILIFSFIFCKAGIQNRESQTQAWRSSNCKCLLQKLHRWSRGAIKNVIQVLIMKQRSNMFMPEEGIRSIQTNRDHVDHGLDRQRRWGSVVSHEKCTGKTASRRRTNA